MVGRREEAREDDWGRGGEVEREEVGRDWEERGREGEGMGEEV